MKNFYIKTNRVFTPVRKYGWIFTFLVAFGGLWFPKLGLLVIPVIIALISISFFKGRYWCGNLCAHGSMFDSLLLPLSRNKKIPGFLKSRITAWAFFLWFSFNMGRRVLAVSAIWGTASFLDKLGFIFVTSYLMVTVVGGTLSILINSRTWCSFCPMGIMQTLSYRLGKLLHVSRKTDVKVTISDKDKCIKCAKCSRVCPMQLTPHLEFSDKNQFDNEACIKCSTCVANCPVGLLSIKKEEEANIQYCEINKAS